MRIFISLILALCLAGMAIAQDDTASTRFGGDDYIAGSRVVHDTPGADDLFAAGESLSLEADVTDSVVAFGRDVVMTGAMGGDIYSAAFEITLQGPVGGDAMLAGYSVTIDSPISGDLRAAASEINLAAPVGGSAILLASEVSLDGVIAGDAMISAQTVDFGRGAEVAGTLILYEEEPGTLDVPERVAPDDRVLRRLQSDWDSDVPDFPTPVKPRNVVGGFLSGVLLVALIAALIAGLLPDQLAAMRRRVIDAPFGMLWLGFLTMSAIIGSAVLFAMTVIGLLVTPASIFVAILTGVLGYVIGAYAFGVGLMLAVGRDEPDSIGDRALAAGIGALAAGLIGLIPFLGWLFVLGVALAGVGALAARLFRPAFFTEPA
ncbi:MAG: hypothetical protein HKO95_05150 [Rhodobacteraceae bacterium]|nr:hypothetical protein [Alphaproteobacteria bacterium]NNK66101.1 hypothetical protein [Paracoccaceae bacterium]